MVNFERERILSAGGGNEFQRQISYQDFNKAPRIVVRQTNALLALFYQGGIRKPDLAKDYLQEYTIAFLRDAEKGSEGLYSKGAMILSGNPDLEIKEAASFAFVVFGSLPNNLKSPFLPNGFSKRGILKGPATRKDFLKRVEELKIGVWRIVDGQVEPRTVVETNPALLRTFGFFKVGSNLPVKVPEDEGKREKEKFNDFLKGIEISL